MAREMTAQLRITVLFGAARWQSAAGRESRWWVQALMYESFVAQHWIKVGERGAHLSEAQSGDRSRN
jgi:hypothetical protein